MSEFPEGFCTAWSRLEQIGWKRNQLEWVCCAERGHRNRVFIALHNGEKAVVRVPGRKSGQTERKRRGFRREMYNLSAAARSGVAPSPYLADPSDGFLVLPFVSGTHPVRRKVSVDSAVRIAQCLRVLHRKTEPFRQGTDFLRRIRTRVQKVQADPETARTHAKELPDVAGQLEATLNALDHSTPPPVPCHGDLVLANIIDDGGRVFLIDWETSTAGDPHQDVGTVLLRARLGQTARQAFLSAYFEGDSDEASEEGAARVRLWEAARALDKALIYWRNGTRTGVIDDRVEGWTRRCAKLLATPQLEEALQILRRCQADKRRSVQRQ